MIEAVRLRNQYSESKRLQLLSSRQAVLIGIDNDEIRTHLGDAPQVGILCSTDARFLAKRLRRRRAKIRCAHDRILEAQHAKRLSYGGNQADNTNHKGCIPPPSMGERQTGLSRALKGCRFDGAARPSRTDLS